MMNLFGSKPKVYENIGAPVFQEKMRNDPQGILLDIRSKEEYALGYIPGSLLLDINQPDFPDQVLELDKDKSYYLYCRSGSRSARACSVMGDMGFKKLFNLAGGINQWKGELKVDH